MRAISLFSGAGGLDVGFERAGFHIVFANEANHDAADSWRKNRSDGSAVMREGDIADYLDEIGALDDIAVVFGGPPCQGFSVAGKMDENDPRNAQIDVFLDVVEKTCPKVFLLENVKALGTHRKWTQVRSNIFSRAQCLRYDIAMVICRAADFGVPERRERAFFVGVRCGLGSVDGFSSAMDECRIGSPPLRNVLMAAGAFGSTENPATCTAKIIPAKKPVKRGSAYTGMLVNGSGRPLDLDALAPTLTASMGGNKTPIVDQRALEDAGQRNWFEGLYERVGEADYSQTPVPGFVRRLTLKEAALIQSFPADYHFSGSVCSQYKQIGNAVPCKLAEAAAFAVKRILGSTEDVVA